jgi:hypothetical protein
MTFEDTPRLMAQDEPVRNSGLSSAIPLAIAALVGAGAIVFYGANGGQFSPNHSAPTMAHSDAPAGGAAAPQTTTR